LNDMSIFSTINTMICSSPAYSRKKNDMSIYQNIASLLIPYILVLLFFQLIHTYPIFECREAFEGGDDQGKETIPFCAIERLDGMCFSFRNDYTCLLSPSVDPS
jgi:hypothetical protein